MNPRVTPKLPLYAAIVISCAAAVVLIGLRDPRVGWPILLIAVVVTLFLEAAERRQIGAVQVVLAALGLTPINTSLGFGHVVVGLVAMAVVVLVPYLWVEHWHHDNVIRFTMHHGRKWYRTEVAYIGFTALITYLVLPVYFAHTGAYHNWSVGNTPGALVTLFIALFAVGVWDEMLFIATILGIFRRHLPFWWANIAQAIIFSSFLYDLGFRSWGVVFACGFALIQGYVFARTKSLLYAITIHLTLDLMLFFALIHAYHPAWLPIFITR